MLLPAGTQNYHPAGFPAAALVLALLCLGFGVWLVNRLRQAQRVSAHQPLSTRGHFLAFAATHEPLSPPAAGCLVNEVAGSIDRDREADAGEIVAAVSIVQ